MNERQCSTQSHSETAGHDHNQYS